MTRRARARGQYMVEFALTFIFFIGVLFAGLQIMLIGYNYNLAERAVWEAARSASVGYKDRETCTGLDPVTFQEATYFCGVYDVIDEKFTRRAFTGGMTQIALTAYPIVTPETPVERAEGADVTVDLSFKGGFFIPGLGTITTITFPVRATLPIVANNDLDRDGCNDNFEAVWPFDLNLPDTALCNGVTAWQGSHTNLTVAGGVPDAITPPRYDSSPMNGSIPFLSRSSTGDDDGDGIPNYDDWGMLRICGDPRNADDLKVDPPTNSISRAIFIHNDSRTFDPTPDDRFAGANFAAVARASAAGNDTGPLYGGKFATRLWWRTSTGRTVEDDWHWLPRDLPWGQREFYADGGCITLLLDLHYDRDNDGWEDKYDDFPTDYRRH